MSKQKRAAIYVRVSTGNQNTKSQRQEPKPGPNVPATPSPRSMKTRASAALKDATSAHSSTPS